MTKTLLALCLPLMLISCASIKPIEKPRTLTEREKVLEYYRKLREQNLRPKKTIKKKKVTYIPRRPKKPKIKMVDKQAQKIEIEQRLVFYCMENRRSNRFDEDQSCESYTQSIYFKCQDSFIDGDARLTRCVRSRLK